MHCYSACILSAAGEMLSVAEHFLEQQMHPTVVISAYRMALDDMVSTLKKIRYGAGLDMGNVEAQTDRLDCSEEKKGKGMGWEPLGRFPASTSASTTHLCTHMHKVLSILA